MRFALFTLCAFCAFCAFLFVDSRGRSVPSVLCVLCVLLLCVLFICHYPIPSEPTIRHSITAKRKKTHQLPLAIPYRHLQTLLERAVASCLLRGCGVLTRAACRVRNDSGGIRAEKEVRGSALAHARRDSGFAERVGSAAKSAKPPGGGALPCCVLRRTPTPRNGPLPCCVLRRNAEH